MSVFAARWRRPSPIGLTPVRLDDFVDAEAWVETAPLADAAEQRAVLPCRPFQRLHTRSAPHARRAAARHRRDRRHGFGSPGSGRKPIGARRPGGHDRSGRRPPRPRRADRHDRLPRMSPDRRAAHRHQSERNVLYEIGGEPHARPPAQERAAPFRPTSSRWPRTACTSVGPSTSEGRLQPRRLRGPQRHRGRQGEGAVAVGDRVDVGTTVQFQVRDAASADEDLRELVGGVPRTVP